MRAILRPGMLCVFALLTACGYNVKTIKNFEGASSTFTDSYSKVVAQASSWCRQSQTYFAITRKEYVGQSTVETWTDRCNEYDKNNKSALVSNSIVNGYAQALVLTIGVTPQYLNDDLSKMKTVLSELKTEGGKPKVDPDKLNATESLVKLLTEAYVSAKVKDKTVEIIRLHKNAVNDNIYGMIGYVESVYKDELELMTAAYDAVNDDIATTTTPKEGQGVADVVAARFLLDRMTTSKKDLENAKGIVDKFSKTGEALIAANDELEEKFATLSKEDQLQAVVDFAEKAKDLRESILKIE